MEDADWRLFLLLFMQYGISQQNYSACQFDNIW